MIIIGVRSWVKERIPQKIREKLTWTNAVLAFNLFLNIGIIGFILFTYLPSIQLSHVHSFWADFEIRPDNRNEIPDDYVINQSFNFTLGIINKWPKPLYGSVEIRKDGCINIEHICNYFYNCPEPFVQKIEDTLFITLKGNFSDTCVNDVKLCIYVREPLFDSNHDDECFTISRSKEQKLG